MKNPRYGILTHQLGLDPIYIEVDNRLSPTIDLHIFNNFPIAWMSHNNITNATQCPGFPAMIILLMIVFIRLYDPANSSNFMLKNFIWQRHRVATQNQKKAFLGNVPFKIRNILNTKNI